MTLLYPQFLWLFIPLGLLFWLFRPATLLRTVHLIILGLLLLTLSRPQIKEGLQTRNIDARDILIALDVSYSMRAEDLSPSRYDYAKETITHLLDQNTHDNIMLIAFTTNPLLLSPPTTDHQLVRTALDALELKNILTKGTSLAHLFQKIASLKKVQREVVLITDGGEEKDLQKLLDALEGVPVHLTILATGTTKGTTVPTQTGSMLKDKENHLVISRINPLLKRLAEATGGTYLQASGSPQKDADALMKAFNAYTQTQQTAKQYHSYTELYYLPLLLAIILFVMLHTRASRYLVLLFALAGVELHAGLLEGITLQKAYTHYHKGEYNTTRTMLEKLDTPSLQQRYALASVYYRMGNYPKAGQLFRSIRTTSPALKQRLYYNIANCYAQEGLYDKAKIYYTKALQLGEEKDAAYNLALVIHLKNRNRTQLGIAHPKSQGDKAGKSDLQASDEKSNQTRKEDQPSSGSGSGGQNRQHGKKEKQEHQRLKLDETAPPQPLSSKVYELINKGYIRETHPW
jgi:Ca-activated chloride channel family protein